MTLPVTTLPVTFPTMKLSHWEEAKRKAFIQTYGRCYCPLDLPTLLASETATESTWIRFTQPTPQEVMLITDMLSPPPRPATWEEQAVWTARYGFTWQHRWQLMLGLDTAGTSVIDTVGRWKRALFFPLNVLKHVEFLLQLPRILLYDWDATARLGQHSYAHIITRYAVNLLVRTPLELTTALVRTVSNPEKSYQTWHAVHPLLGALSVTTTLAGYGAAVFFAFPIVASALALSATAEIAGLAVKGASVLVINAPIVASAVRDVARSLYQGVTGIARYFTRMGRPSRAPSTSNWMPTQGRVSSAESIPPLSPPSPHSSHSSTPSCSGLSLFPREALPMRLRVSQDEDGTPRLSV